MSDYISRADAIEAVAKLQKYDLDERNRLRIYAPWHKPKRIFVETEAIYKTIYTLPSADAVQGEWIWRTDIPIGDGRTSAGYVCSNCGKDYWHGNVFDSCPNCGAKMENKE